MTAEGSGAARDLAREAARRRLARDAERRREAVGLLRIAECGVRYAISELSNGTGPAEARDVAVEMASELSMVAGALRRLTRLEPAERRALARSLTALGMSQREVADRLGVSLRTAWPTRGGRVRAHPDGGSICERITPPTC